MFAVGVSVVPVVALAVVAGVTVVATVTFVVVVVAAVVAGVAGVAVVVGIAGVAVECFCFYVYYYGVPQTRPPLMRHRLEILTFGFLLSRQDSLQVKSHVRSICSNKPMLESLFL